MTRCLGVCAGWRRRWSAAGHTNFAPPNYGHWEYPVGYPLDSTDEKAYWGVAYLPMITDSAHFKGTNAEAALSRARGLWRCPESVRMDPDTSGGGYSDQEEPATYGLNMLVTISPTNPAQGRKTSSIRQSSEVIVCQDAVEHRLECFNGDGTSQDCLSAGTGTINLMQWRPKTNSASYALQGALREYYRHNHRCNVLWLDGHVNGILKSTGTDVPRRWCAGVPTD